MLGPSSGIVTGLVRRRKQCWFLISPFRRFATPSPASGGRDYFVPSGVNAGPSSGIVTGLARRRKHWARQAAWLLSLSSGANAGFLSLFHRFATPSPASGGRDYFVPSGVNAGPSSGINTGSSKRRKHWFRQSGVVDGACRHRDLSGALANASGFPIAQVRLSAFPNLPIIQIYIIYFIVV